MSALLGQVLRYLDDVSEPRFHVGKHCCSQGIPVKCRRRRTRWASCFAQILKHQYRDLFTVDDFTGLSNIGRRPAVIKPHSTIADDPLSVRYDLVVLQGCDDVIKLQILQEVYVYLHTRGGFRRTHPSDDGWGLLGQRLYRPGTGRQL